MSLPSFLVIGPSKCGTTSIYHYLKQHPEVYLPRIKEINFFAYHGQKGRYWAKTLDEYRGYFKAARYEKALGEVTPYYFASTGTAARIYDVIPNARIITILRNPIDRAYSHYNMYVRSGKEKRSAGEALLDETSLYTRVGFYYRNLNEYFKLFDKKNIKVFFYEQLVNSTQKLLKDLFGFIGVNNSFQPNLGVKHARGYLPKNKIINKLLDNYITRFVIKPIIPEKLLDIGIKIKNMNSRKPDKLPDEIRGKLKEVYKPDLIKLEEVLNSNLSKWYL